MKFTVSSTALSRKLAALLRVINSKNSLPILGDYVFDATSDGILRSSAKDQKTGFSATIEETVREVENNEEETEKKNEQVVTELITLQLDSRYAETGYSQTNHAQEEGNIAQRGRCSSYWAVFQVAWLGRDYKGIRQNEAHVLGHSRLARHRRKSVGLYCREEATGSAGRYRAAKADGSGFVGRTGQGHKWRSGESTDRYQSTGSILFINANDRRA